MPAVCTEPLLALRPEVRGSNWMQVDSGLILHLPQNGPIHG